ncbi:MAG TPA: DUF488 family protein [Methanoregulaceae archaeon]|nr:DUF488 family protein [Methanolinea sp.]HPD11156.1 DUF488 family protein [Methanoregulaceae archaeon]HRU80569.1 DUF488 family protein [Methanolinea sp.]
MPIKLKRAYEPPEEGDGYRILVERLWPRGVSKERLKIDLWIKDAGASPELRTWFGHDPEKWEEFRRRYFEEIRERPEVVKRMKDALKHHGTVSFIYAARDEKHNNAAALKEFIEEAL